MGRLEKKEISDFFSKIANHSYLCKGCGVCEGVCPSYSIKLNKNEYSEYIPTFLQEQCIACGKCIAICPGHTIFALKEKKALGKYSDIFLAHSKNQSVRKRGSSGGVISALSIYAIENSIADKAIILNTTESPIDPLPLIAKTKEDVLKCSSSKYVYYPIGNQFKEIDQNTIVTALPCQIAGIRKATKKGIILGLFCSKAVTSDLIQYIAQKEKIKFDDIKSISYRKGKWPGNVTIETENRIIEIPYNKSYYTAAFNSSLFSPQGCLFCNDYMSDKADISFGDPWSKTLSKKMEDNDGHSVVIVRTSKGKKLVDRAISDGAIIAEDLSPNIVAQGHVNGIYSKRSGLGFRLKFLERHKMPVPYYDPGDIINASWFVTVWEYFYLVNSFFYRKKKRYLWVFKFSKRYMFFRRFAVAFIQRFFMKRTKYMKNISM